MRLLPLILLAACGPQSTVASPTPVYPPDAAPDPNAPDARVDSKDELPMAEVEASMQPVRDAVQACAAATTFEGKVTVQVTIYPEGNALAEVLDGDPEVDGCVVDAFAKATFPTSGRGQRFKYSFTF